MVANTTAVRLDDVAQGLFSAITQFGLATPRSRRRSGDLKEVEYLTLSLLQQHHSMIVGDIQRLLGVLPAQMSRIIRSLEARERSLIACRINPHDKRKIDVCLTPAGDKALQDYRAARIRGIVDVLAKLSEDDLEDLSRLLDKLNAALDRGSDD